MPAKAATTTTKKTTRSARKAGSRTTKRAARSTRKTASRTRKQVRSTAKRATRTTKRSAKRGTKKATRTTHNAARKTAPARTRRTTSRSPDALALIKSDHATVKGLFRRYKGLGDGALKSKTQTMERIVTELSVHASVEEQVFYPDVKRRVPGSKRLVDHGLDEHQELKETLARLQRMSPDSPEFDAIMRKVIVDVTDHVKEEERELFPKVRKAMSKQELTDMAALMRTAKRAAPTRPHPLAPSTPPGNVIVGAAAALVDKARDAVRGPGKRAR
jgi:hemerythrin superfamily protein